MKKFCSISFALILSAALAAGCGGGGGDDDDVLDGAVVRLDGRVDARMADARVPGMCNQGSTGTTATFNRCTTDANCLPGSECLPLGTAGSFCFRCCDGTGAGPIASQCDVGTACVQNGAPRETDPTRQALENHCFFSSCGGQAGMTNGTGDLESECEIGQDLWTVGATGFEKGWCQPLSDGATGFIKLGNCQAAGTLAIGAACPFSSAPGTAQCARTPAGNASVCIGRQGDTMGTCAEICNPTMLGTNGCGAGKFCQDQSTKLLSQGMSVIGTWGFCVDEVACDVTKDAMAPAATNTAPAGCMGVMVTPPGGVAGPATCSITTPARPFGVCARAVGAVAVNAACTNPPAAVANACVAATTCGPVEDPAVATSTCMTWCNNPSAAGTANAVCTGGTTCKPYIWDPDTAAVTTDDIIAEGFGVCQP